MAETCLNHWLKADFIVNRISKALLAAKVSLRRLNAYMAEQELNLLELPAGLVTQTRACAPHVVGSHIVEAAFRTSSFHNTPDDLWTESRLSNPLGLVDGPKDRPSGDTAATSQEGEPRFRAVPFDEFANRVIVGALGTGRSEAIQNGRL